MIGTRRMRAVGAVLTAVLAASLVTSLPGTAQEDDADPSADFRLGTGTWDGTLHYQAQASFPDLDASVNQEPGTFTADIDREGAATGTFHVQAAGFSVGDVGGASLSIIFDGDVTGINGKPVLEGTSGSFNGTATVQGITVPVGGAFGAGDLGPAELVVDTATPCQVAGEWGFEVPPAVAGAGGTADINGRWAAVRTGTTAGRTAEVSEILQHAAGVQTSVLAGQLVGEELLTLVHDAEQLAASLKADPKCGPDRKRGRYNLVVSDALADMIEAAFADPNLLTSAQLYDLFNAAVGAGLFSGAIAPNRGNDLRDAFHDEWNRRLDVINDKVDGTPDDVRDGLLEEFRNDLLVIWVAGRTGGWKDTVNKAEEVGACEIGPC